MFTHFTYGTRFRIGSTEYEYLAQRESDVEVLNITIGEKELLPMQEILVAYNSKDPKSRLIFSEYTSEQLVIDYVPEDYTESELKIMNIRYQAIEPYIKGELKNSDFKSYIENFPSELKRIQKLSEASIYRWAKLWSKRNNKIDLIPKRTGPKSKRIDDDELSEIYKIINKYEKKSETFTVRDQYMDLKSIVEDINMMREEKDKLKLSSESTFRRIYKQHVNTLLRDKELMGHANAMLKHKGVQTPQRATLPLEELEIDWTPVDCLIKDFENNEAFRPVLMFGIDQATNEPMGLHIIMKKEPDVGDFLQLLLNCILPKTYLKELYPRVQKEWSAYGVPQTIVLDNAKVNESRNLEEICSFLGIGVRYTGIGAGNQKGKVEQALGNINHKAFQGLSGSMFSNPQEKGAYDSKAKATVSLTSLLHIAHITIVDRIANNFNRGENIQGVPEQLWKQGLLENHIHPSIPYSREYLELLFSTKTAIRVISPRGIKLMGHFFYSEELNKLRRDLDKNGKSIKVMVRFGSDMRTIYIRDEGNNRYVQADIKDGGLGRLNIDKNYPILPEVLEYWDNKHHSELNAFDNTHVGKAIREIEEIQEEDKKLNRNLKKQKAKMEASKHLVISASKGVSAKHLRLPENTIISDISDNDPSKSVTAEKTDSEEMENHSVIPPKPGELCIEEIDLEAVARTWGIGKRSKSQ
ncbi:putative transposase [Paenibacillus polysaccharolyticus]|uniref:Putative transposase n=1 Tax=Paenibacillus polysaccharolyticus TaxID=582692 RepID=A0A1G5GUC5_9BACL|nr:hypothetical protein [Paenibacillus polysaccharolyticus]SCY54228.1 putative transposase [Paenibacillus polysaccharolyticus]